jgi:hypothetical protein
VTPTADADSSPPAQGSSIRVTEQADLAESASSPHPVCTPAWLSGLESIGPGFRFDPSVPHPARVMATGWAVRIITRLTGKWRRR